MEENKNLNIENHAQPAEEMQEENPSLAEAIQGGAKKPKKSWKQER